MIILRKTILYLLILALLIMCIRNYISTTSQFIFSNLSIRDAYYQQNGGLFDANNDGKLDFVKKGTHDGGQDYFKRINSYINSIKSFDYKFIISLMKRSINIDFDNSNFSKEHKLIHKLIEYSKMQNDYKLNTAIYIPKNNKVYWNISCDSLMIPFIVPAISNITNILALPTKPWSNSCFGQLDGYGYGIYLKLYQNQIPNNNNDYSNLQICNKAKIYSINNIIKLYFENNDIIEEQISCK